jgi:hypothetical protein
MEMQTCLNFTPHYLYQTFDKDESHLFFKYQYVTQKNHQSHTSCKSYNPTTMLYEV